MVRNTKKVKIAKQPKASVAKAVSKNGEILAKYLRVRVEDTKG